MRRRHLLVGLSAVATAAIGARCGFSRLARPPDPDGPLSAEAEALINEALSGLDAARIVDDHVHCVGIGAGGTGCYVNKRMEQWARHPVEAMRFSIYRKAAGVLDEAKGDQQYIERLTSLLRSKPAHGRALLLAFEEAYHDDGTVNREESEFHAPNSYVLKLAKEHPDCFIPAVSIHPYRKDAVEELARCVEGGAAAVKWLPNAMNIDPASEKCDAFYDALAKHQLPIVTHAGEVQAVDAEELQKLGNPLRLRRALDRGVKVIVAHCASLGKSEDLDDPNKAEAESFDLFVRMLGEEKYKGLLFGDISATTQFNRCATLKTLLEREDLHPRLIYGSDYPLPAINALVRTGPLESMKLITAAQRRALNELDRHNPLLFDLVSKRVISQKRSGKEIRFPNEVFQLRPGLFRGIS